jgi:hypothetical protein
MTRLEEAERAIDGVGRLAILDRSGGEGFGRDMASAARSFSAYALILPVIALVLAVNVTVSGSPTPGLFAVSDALGTVIEITGLPLLLIPVLRLYGRSERWAWFVAALNWFTAARIVFWLAVLGLCYAPLQGLGLWPLRAFLVYAWVVEAFMAESVLEIGGLRAAGIVLLDFFFNLAVDAVAAWIGGGSLF